MMGLRISSSMSQCFAELETKTLHGLYLDPELTKPYGALYTA